MATGKIVKGIDSFHPLTVDTLKCFKKNGYYFVIPRAYRSFGAVDNNALQSLKNAKNLSMHADIYMWPCFGKDPVQQAD